MENQFHQMCWVKISLLTPPEDWDHFEPMMLNALHRLPALETAGVKLLLNGPESFYTTTVHSAG